MFPMVHNLFYSWDGWPSQGVFPPEPTASFFDSLNAAWRQDGFVLRAKVWAPDQIQLTFEVEPKFSPVFFAGRVKGRLQHALRKAGIPCEFSRKVAMRALGDNRSGVVEGYLRQQTARAELVDERYRATPIIIVTSLEKEEDKRRGVAAGADAYIVKRAFDQSTLLDTVRSLIG